MPPAILSGDRIQILAIMNRCIKLSALSCGWRNAIVQLREQRQWTMYCVIKNATIPSSGTAYQISEGIESVFLKLGDQQQQQRSCYHQLPQNGAFPSNRHVHCSSDRMPHHSYDFTGNQAYSAQHKLRNNQSTLQGTFSRCYAQHPFADDTEISFDTTQSLPTRQSATLTAVIMVAAVPSEAVEGFGPVVGAMRLMEGLHSVSNMPWWATLSVTAVGVRLAMLPLSVQQMRATSTLWPLFTQARKTVMEQRVQQRLVKSKPTVEARSAAAAASAAEKAASAGTASAARQAQLIAAAFWKLRRQTGAPHPAWIVAVPLIQLPVFVTAMWAARRMALVKWPGMTTGGMAWFPDLTIPALDLSATFVQQAVPLGTMGVVLPAAVTAAMFANVGLAFGKVGGSSGQSRSAVADWLGSKMRLALEWLTVPMFLVALQLAHAPLVYWLTSTLFTLGQHFFLHSPSVRSMVGLSLPHTGHHMAAPAFPRSAAKGGPPADSVAEATSATGAMDSETDSETAEHFRQAAELVAAKDYIGARPFLMSILERHAAQPHACFALGQVHAALKNWPEAADFYDQAGKGFHGVPVMSARARLGLGIALERLGNVEGALEALRASADLVAPQAPVIRLSETLSKRPESKRATGIGGTLASVPAVGRSHSGRNDRAARNGGKETAIRALLSAASIFAKTGRKKEAIVLVQRATTLDPLIRDKFLVPLEVEVAAEG